MIVKVLLQYETDFDDEESNEDTAIYTLREDLLDVLNYENVIIEKIEPETHGNNSITEIIDFFTKNIKQRIYQLENDKLIDKSKKAILISENKRFLAHLSKMVF